MKRTLIILFIIIMGSCTDNTENLPDTNLSATVSSKSVEYYSDRIDSLINKTWYFAGIARGCYYYNKADCLKYEDSAQMMIDCANIMRQQAYKSISTH